MRFFFVIDTCRLNDAQKVFCRQVEVLLIKISAVHDIVEIKGVNMCIAAKSVFNLIVRCYTTGLNCMEHALN